MFTNRVPTDSSVPRTSSLPDQEDPPSSRADAVASNVFKTPPPSRYAVNLGRSKRVKPLRRQAIRPVPLFDAIPDPEDKSHYLPFSNALPTESSSVFESVYAPKELHACLETAYQCPDRPPLQVIKQPPQSKSCGAGATLMLLLSYWQTSEHPAESAKEHLNYEFWMWYSRCELSDRDCLKNVIQRFTNYEAITGIFPGGTSHIDALRKMKKILDENRLPIICSITHPKLEGHWIVIDQISFVEETVWLRDPYSGMAYKVNFDEFQDKCWGEPIEESYLFIG